MRVKCELCGRNVETTKGNYVFANGIHQHRKCPTKPKLTKEERQERRKLTDYIDKVTKDQRKPLSPAGWKIVTSQIKKLEDLGYSYSDQLYALKWWLEIKDEEFKGFGIVEYIIEEALLYKKRLEEFKSKR